MASTAENTIVLFVNGSERPILSDMKAADAVTKPGAVIAPASASTVAAVASADAVNRRMFAVETAHAPLVNTPNIDQAYASGDTVYYVRLQPGDVVNAIIGASQTVLVGSLLATNGTAGQLAVESTNTDARLIGFALEAVTTGAGETARCRVCIL